MDRRWLSLGSLALASCCCRPCAPCGAPCGAAGGAPVSAVAGRDPDMFHAPSNFVPPAEMTAPKVIDFAPMPMGVQPPDLPPPATRWPERKPAALPAGFEDELKRIHGLTDEVAQRRALARLHTMSPDALADADPASLAAVAPTVLRVYDLSAVLADGGDYPEAVAPLALDERGRNNLSAPARGPEARLDRIKDRLRLAGGVSSWADEDTFLVAIGRSIVVLQSPPMLGTLEGLLDRLATTGGPLVRLRVDMLHDAGELANEFGVERASGSEWKWKAQPVAPGRMPTEARLAAFRTESFALDAPWGRRIGARKSVSTAYVQDFSAETSGFARPVADPVVGTVREGLALTADLVDGAGGAESTRAIHVDLHDSVLKRPMGTFTTNVGGAPVTLELPEVTLLRFEGTLAYDPTAGAAYVLQPIAGGTSALLRIEPLAGAISPVKPAWNRVTPSAAAAAGRHRLATVKFDFWTGTGGKEDDRVTSSQVTVFEGQRATVQVANRVSYIRDYDVDGSGATQIVNPVVGSVADGVAVDFSVLPGDGDARVIDGRFTSSILEHPIRVFEAQAGETPMQVQLPESRDVVVPFRVVLQPGEEKRLPPVPFRVESGPAGHVVVGRQELTVSIRYVSAEAVR